MRRGRVLLALGASCVALGTRNDKIGKVVEMLVEKKNEVLANGQEMKVQWSAFKTWCDSTFANTEEDIEEFSAEIKRLEADIAGKELIIKKAIVAIDTATVEALKDKKDIKAMEHVREAEKTAFVAAETELNDSIYACEKARETLQAVPDATPVAGSALLQLKLNKINFGTSRGSHRRAIENLLEIAQEPPAGISTQKVQQPQGAEYAMTRNSGTEKVISMLGELQDSFEEELRNLQDGERKNIESYELQKDATEEHLRIQNNIIADETAVKTQNEAEKGELEQSLTSNTNSLAESKKYLKETSAECTQKAADFVAAQNSMGEEATAIEKAVEIMQGPEVTTGGGNLASTGAADTVSFLQVGTSRKSQPRLTQFLKEESLKVNSKLLMQLASLAQDGPFDKVKGLIEKEIKKLQEEVMKRQTDKNWCDSAIAENTREIEKYTDQKQDETIAVETLTVRRDTLKEEIAQLTKSISEKKKAMAEATTNRNAERKESERIVKESREAEEAVKSAIEVLTEYYGDSGIGGTASLVQQGTQESQSPKPEFEGGEYSSSGEGILGMLTTIEADFSKTAAETDAEDSTAQESYEKFMKESKIFLASSGPDLENSRSKLAETKQSLLDAADAAKAATENLEAETKYKNDTVDPKCVKTAVSAEERNAKRESEIKSLTEALEILSQTAP
ncbi:unnamed protein product [Amoebophrya sp. A25]|nr:unnamed protein product [Amoebophrya sp. A25]|eukprot:GSA25T00011340001.1